MGEGSDCRLWCVVDAHGGQWRAIGNNDPRWPSGSDRRGWCDVFESGTGRDAIVTSRVFFARGEDIIPFETIWPEFPRLICQLILS